jgi:hypothetical protein
LDDDGSSEGPGSPKRLRAARPARRAGGTMFTTWEPSLMCGFRRWSMKRCGRL